MKPILCETCLNCEKEITQQITGWYKRKITTLNYYCTEKDRYVKRAEKYKCNKYINRRLEDFINVK